MTNSLTLTTPAMTTGVGMILGTATYMSPEQAKGRPADKRSDVWAFGWPGADQTTPPPSIVVVQHFGEELRRLVPSR